MAQIAKFAKEKRQTAEGGEMKKRYRIPKLKPNELSICYGIEERGCNPDVLYCHGGEGATSSDSKLLCYFIEGVTYFENRNLRQELEHRGYDITTIKFSIKKTR